MGDLGLVIAESRLLLSDSLLPSSGFPTAIQSHVRSETIDVYFQLDRQRLGSFQFVYLLCFQNDKGIRWPILWVRLGSFLEPLFVFNDF